MANRYSLVAILCALFALVVSVPAAAQNKAVEAQARGLAKKAMEEDYLSTEFDKAVEKLNQAISKCGTDKCGAPLRAQLKRNLGVIQVAGLNKKSDGVASFAEAMKIDPTIALDPDLKTKEVEAAWEEAKRQVGGGGAAVAPKPETGGSTAPPTGDFTHTPATEQLVRTPVPIYAEYTGSESLAKVVAKYKAFGMTEWKQIELKPMEKGFGGEIPCMDVQQGDVQYYLQGFDAKNDPVATAGDRNRPYKVPVKRDKIESEAPHLPGREPAKQCADTGDCPPGFPGCKSGEGAGAESTLKSEGADCEEDTECKSGTCGKSKTCTGEGEEEGVPKKRSRLWLGVAGQIDFIVLPSGDDVCLLHGTSEPSPGTPVNSAGYYCTTSSGADFPGRNEADNPVQGKSDKVSGGAAPANIRVMITADLAVTSNILVGLRVGFVANTYPGTQAATFAPIHLEARFTYVFGKDALAKAGIAGYLFGGAGAAEWDAQVPVTAVSRKAGGGTNTVQAWNVGGPGFVSLGGGIRYAFTPRIAGMFGPRFNVAFGGTSTLLSISPELGLAFGF